ncbi:MAG: 30S ribosomal protein S3ae [Candidatus Methanomethylophilaceae archaeon]|jgi:small subunit ribosomal protein S3Ae|nr:SSU ribosomal protein S3AE [Methanomassiliicoccales archaeon RumEn M2]MDD2779011.1 30S ribosomal protein S3ae [Candidatus Methanomethylophilaceae archaeon]MDI9378211.1 30S ribosomal protein S3ae [Candidatus Thermoplasmatota archaeon]MDD3128574.1 30S ribosomal protein S3ae [Candidatus Methanomethylophilaceae archaeon]MDD4119761.1 30S ribosomal protein S3ae [Candidatus Methanomethylophilaceae archaeon]
MAAKKSKGTSRKIKDKWKAKEWYKVHASRMFNEAEIGETPAADPATLIGRTAEVTVQELTGDFSKMHIKVKFKINSVDGYNAKSVFVGHSLTSEYVRRLTRRKKTKTDHVVDVKTKDGFVIRIKPMSIAEKRIQASQEDAMRRIMHDVLMQMGVENNLSDIIKAIISGDMARDLAKACRTIMPMKRIEIRKSEILEFAEENDSAIEAPKEEAPEEDGPEEGSAEETSEEKEPEEESEE